MIAKKINDGKQVAAGVIPADTPDIIYVVRGRNFGVSQNGPNPFSQITTIEFAIPEASHVTLAIYDVTGRLVRTLVDGNCKPNVYRASWDGTDNSGRLVASGPYFYRFEAGRFSATKKMMLVK
jgi:flagellar hook assembly protein FlgD